ncbi:MAG: PD-(D/E)XK nuclease family protein, partial [Polaromonas sp.]|nr:PD-(D/E)XK nuclease family protein [Polaromonas sp.]
VADEDSDLARIGKAMHRLLEWGSLAPPQLRAVVREFRLSPAQGQQAAERARSILAGAGAWAWNEDVMAWQGDEVELFHAGQLLRLDRLVQRRDAGHEGHWWVLDYKSNAAPQRLPELVATLQAYRAAVQALHPGHTVKAAFLTPQGAVLEVP